MSTNLLQNGNFSLPVITTNSFKGYTNFTAAELTSFYWTCANTYVSVQNGNTAFGFPDPSLINCTQFCSLQYTASIQQSFTITQLNKGIYKLFFYYSYRYGYDFNNMEIYVNGVLFDTLLNSPGSNWYTYLQTIPLTLGVNTILFQGTYPSQERDIGLANIQIYYSNDNNIKTTNIYGGLTVYNYLPTGGTTTPGRLTTSQTLNYNYNGLPTYTANSLGYIYNYTSAVTTVAATTYINSSAFTLPIGVYYVTTYCRFTPSSSSTYLTHLGLSSVTSLYTGYDYITLNRLTASSLVSTLLKPYILTLTASTTIYFVFIASIAGNLNGTLNGRILRIA